MTRISITIAALALAVGLAACKKDEKNPEAPAQPTTAAPANPEAATAAPKKAPEPAATEDIGSVSTEELQAWIAAKEVAVFDSNGEGVRKEHGKIPTATLLSNYVDYELSELPAEKDKKLVFYCSNTKCGASKKSASKALAAGYSDVHILPAGVIGWKEAGNETEAAM